MDMKRCLWIFLSLVFFSLPVQAMPGEIAIIVNRQNPVNSLEDGDLIGYYLNQTRRWEGGAKVVPINRNNGSPEQSLFLKEVLKKTGQEMAEYWISRKETSGDASPQEVSSDGMVIRFVGSIEGAIGYVAPSSLKESLHSDKVKVIRIVSD